MPKVSNLPQHLKPYVFHGVQVDYSSGKDNVVGVCPFCTREKFSIKVETGEWRCFSCNVGTDTGKVNRGGNVYRFFQLLHKAGIESGSIQARSDLATNRRLLDPHTLDRWCVAPSTIIFGDWLVLGHSQDKKVNNLYRYSSFQGKRLLLATPGLNHSIYGSHLFDPCKQTIYLCEGPWDAMALEEVLRRVTRAGSKTEDTTLTLTGNESISLYSTANVLAVPGCGTFSESWLPLFVGKDVVILYDNDHPRKHPHTGHIIPPVAHEGLKRVVQLLASAEEPPKSISYLFWGEEGYDDCLPHGYDVRDWLSDVTTSGTSNAPTIRERLPLLQDLLSLISPIPPSWISGRSATSKAGGTEIDCKDCQSWEQLIPAWQQAMYWTDGLDRGLSFALSVVVSTMAVGDQLWGKMIGPASCGKSTICEALSVNRRYVKAKSTIRGFHSGMRAQGGGDEDMSLISQCQDKTLVTKDGDALLQAPNLSQILSEARDIYDRVSRTHYRNGAGRDYSGINMTWLLCGTSSLRALDASELGERFLDCVIMDEIDVDMEWQILWRVVQRTHKCMSYEANGKLETQHDPDLVEAMRLTGGYVTYLRQNAQRLLEQVHLSQAAMVECMKLGVFVAYFRARPSSRQDEGHEREFGARLASQMVRLAQCTAVVLGRKEADEEVMRRVSQVAKDTARGKTLDIARHLYRAGEAGLETKSVGILTGMKEDDVRTILRFMKAVGILDHFAKMVVGSYKGSMAWKINDSVYTLYKEVMGL